MATATRLYSGVDAVKAMDKIREIQANQENWPYIHVFPPVNSITVHQIGVAASPAQGSTVVPLTYKVPSGYRFILAAIVQQFTGGAFNPGDALWTVDLNKPVGIPNTQASPVQGLTAVPVQLGSFTESSPWLFMRAYEFEPLDVLRSKATNVNLGTGGTNFFTSGFFGWLLPAIKSK